jgi:hypothetical protein
VFYCRIFLVCALHVQFISRCIVIQAFGTNAFPCSWKAQIYIWDDSIKTDVSESLRKGGG